MWHIFFSSNKQDSRYFVKNTVEHKSEQGRLRISSTSLLYANLTGCVKISRVKEELKEELKAKANKTAKLGSNDRY